MALLRSQLKIKRIEPKISYPDADFIMKNSFVLDYHHGLKKRHLDKIKEVFRSFLERF